MLYPNFVFGVTFNRGQVFWRCDKKKERKRRMKEREREGKEEEGEKGQRKRNIKEEKKMEGRCTSHQMKDSCNVKYITKIKFV